MAGYNINAWFQENSVRTDLFRKMGAVVGYMNENRYMDRDTWYVESCYDKMIYLTTEDHCIVLRVTVDKDYKFYDVANVYLEVGVVDYKLEAFVEAEALEILGDSIWITLPKRITCSPYKSVRAIARDIKRRVLGRFLDNVEKKKALLKEEVKLAKYRDGRLKDHEAILERMSNFLCAPAEDEEHVLTITPEGESLYYRNSKFRALLHLDVKRPDAEFGLLIRTEEEKLKKDEGEEAEPEVKVESLTLRGITGITLAQVHKVFAALGLGDLDLNWGGDNGVTTEQPELFENTEWLE